MNWQQQAANFAEQYNLKHSPTVHALDAMSELGEVAKELLSGSAYGTQELEIRPNLPAELGDLLYSICLLADSLEIDLDMALAQTLLKYENRWQTTGAVNSGQ